MPVLSAGRDDPILLALIAEYGEEWRNLQSYWRPWPWPEFRQIIFLAQPTLCMEMTRPPEGRAMFAQKLFSFALCLAAAGYVNSANAQQTETSKAEAALAAKVKCADFKKNADGSWTSGPIIKIGTNAFSNHTFDTHGVSVGGSDLATVLNRKCGR
jgi:hypothetical protein